LFISCRLLFTKTTYKLIYTLSLHDALPIYEIDAKKAEELGLVNTQFDIPVTWNKKTAMWVKFFTGRGRQHFINYSQRAGRYAPVDRKSTRLNSSHVKISYAVFCLKKKKVHI